MVAITSPLKPEIPNRRRRVRHKIQAPAYASITVDPQTSILELYEIVDISEEGMAIQCPLPLQADQELHLCLDLAECPEQILTAVRVVWSSGSGRAGLHFSQLPESSLLRLREWLFMNAMAGMANADESVRAMAHASHIAPKPGYTDTLAAVNAIQREVEALGSDFSAALQLIATRAQTLVRASGVAVALSGADPDFMECRASAGPDAPPIGAPLQVGSGFSGECVKSGISLRCDDAELDARVDRETCRALGLRSILAVPVQIGPRSIGIIEAFSGAPSAFTENDNRVLQRFGETVLAALNRAARAENLPELRAEPETSFSPASGSVLFAAKPDPENAEPSPQKPATGISLPLSHLILLVCFAVTISGALGYLTAPLIQAKLMERGRGQLPTVLASSAPPKPDLALSANPSTAALENASFEQVRQLAEKSDPAAENAFALRYFQGDEKAGIKRDEKEAVRWFIQAAQHGNVAAQSKLGFLYWDGVHGLPKDINKAYLWTTVACSHKDALPDPAVSYSKGLAPVLRHQLTLDQAKAIEHQAQQWLERNNPNRKPTASRPVKTAAASAPIKTFPRFPDAEPVTTDH